MKVRIVTIGDEIFQKKYFLAGGIILFGRNLKMKKHQD